MERICAERVIDRLRLEYAGRVELDGFFWEHEPMRATASFADPQNIPLTADFEIVVCILWSRLGTMLSMKHLRKNGEPFPSGTAFEIETAAESYEIRHAPDLMVYRRTAEVPMPVNDPVEAKRRNTQLDALNSFIREWFYDKDSAIKAAINEYAALGQFEAKLERPLRKLILKHLENSPDEDASTLKTELPITYHGSNPFRGLEAYRYEDRKIFFGRSQAIEDVVVTMRKQAAKGCAMTLVHGVSGSGKSSLVRAGVLPMMTHKALGMDGVAYWKVATMQVGASTDGLMGALAASLADGTEPVDPGTSSGESRAMGLALREDTLRVVSPLSDALRKAGQELQVVEELPELPQTKLVLLVDQLEQILSDDRRFPVEERRAFVGALGVLARFRSRLGSGDCEE